MYRAGVPGLVRACIDFFAAGGLIVLFSRDVGCALTRAGRVPSSGESMPLAGMEGGTVTNITDKKLIGAFATWLAANQCCGAAAKVTLSWGRTDEGRSLTHYGGPLWLVIHVGEEAAIVLLSIHPSQLAQSRGGRINSV
ncbi:hypothetical protein GPECTOR_898g148 [Gonium pectorale]|uniref:Uncharacterized protein n=1 Tax=Gonium pectorale TaxID=33097 RepID=A0A150FTV8_GONPE|nr:hypothetical protein GPECTOR_898g148 [Gonium pectorale]|eukprot:KXZ41052.1 hypothetical protein GPECTOR_898g148 [Gonium pectorale]